MQRTLKSKFFLEGRGLHTGLNVCITFHPAPENYGYKIRRIDKFGQPVIDARVEKVVNTRRGIVLSDNGIRVGSVEHALAALYGCEIDNCLMEIDGPEFPALDGSSMMYVNEIEKVGAQEQHASRKFITLKRKRIHVTDTESGAEMLLLPAETLSIQSKIKFNSLLLKQQSAYLDRLSDFAEEIAPARTFVFIKDINSLLQQNLIKGGSLDNAIVIYDAAVSQEEFDRLACLTGTKSRNAKNLGYVMNKPLLYENEPARHKILDLLGDLALTGAFIKGTIMANCPSHKINTLFAKAIRDYYLMMQPKGKNKSKNSTVSESALSVIGDFHWNRP